MRCETRWEVFDHNNDKVVYTGQSDEDVEKWLETAPEGNYEMLESRTWKASAVITYDVHKAWEVWAVDVVVPQHIVDMEDNDEALRTYIESGIADIEFMSMKDSGNNGMDINEVEIT